MAPACRLFLLPLLVSAAFGLVPMATDEVLHDGPARFDGNTWALEFTLLSERPAGLYLGISGVERFRVRLNDSLLDSVLPGSAPRSLLRVLDLAAWTGLLRPGRNRLAVVADEPAEEFAARVWASPHSWYLGSSHSHSTYSDGQLTVRELLHWAARDGARFYGITDHNTLEQCTDTAFRRTGLCEPMRGTEWTVDSGHANLMGILGRDPVPTSGPVYRMIDEARYRGALVHVNHPFSPDHLWRRAPVLDPGIDGIELLNGRMNQHGIEEPAIQWWHSLLVAGHAIPSLSSSDFHDDNGFEKPLKPCARVRASSNHPDTLLRAFKLGRVMSCDRPDGSRLYLYADTSGDGRWDLAMGDHIAVRNRSAPVRFRVEAESVLRDEELIVYDRAGVLLRVRFDLPGDHAREWTAVLSPADTGFVRAELRRANGRAAVLTNPIYVNNPGYRFGPTGLRTRAVFVQGTGGGPARDTEADTGYLRLELKLENPAGYSPHAYGLEVALDTACWELGPRQRQGPGIGAARKQRVGGYLVLTWLGGYRWDNRLRPGEAFTFWVEVKPKRTGENQVLFRSWANDRLFDIAADPDSGLPGPDGRHWHEQTVKSRAAGFKSGESGPRPADRLALAGMSLGRGRVKLRVDVPDPGRLELRLYDMAGRCRVARRLQVLPGPDRPVELELADAEGNPIPAGVYVLQAVAGEPAAPGRAVTRRLLVVE